MKAVISPLEKVVLGDISITFGMQKSEAERLLGKATAVGESPPFCNGRRRRLRILYAMIQKKDEKQSRPFCYLHLFIFIYFMSVFARMVTEDFWGVLVVMATVNFLGLTGNAPRICSAFQCSPKPPSISK